MPNDLFSRDDLGGEGSTKGARHPSLGQCPRGVVRQITAGLKARFICGARR